MNDEEWIAWEKKAKKVMQEAAVRLKKVHEMLTIETYSILQMLLDLEKEMKK
jgi:hypothetical protein